jgi:hypothetical protein
METYPHLVSSQIPRILLYTFIQTIINTVKQSLCNILNSQKIAGIYYYNIVNHRI